MLRGISSFRVASEEQNITLRAEGHSECAHSAVKVYARDFASEQLVP